jgi:hypothetical protein
MVPSSCSTRTKLPGCAAPALAVLDLHHHPARAAMIGVPSGMAMSMA